MNFELDELQEEFKQTANKFFKEKCTVENLHAFEASEANFSIELYNELAEMGFLGLVIPEEYGGFGGRLMDLAIIVEEAGKAMLPSPFIPTIIYGALPVLNNGTEEQKRNFLPPIADGSLMVSNALLEPHAQYELKNISAKAEMKREGEYSLSGSKSFVPYASSAQYLLTLARTSVGTQDKEGLSLFLLNAEESGIHTTELGSIGTDALFEVIFENVTVTDADMLGQEGQGLKLAEQILQTATAVQSVEIAGLLRRVLNVTAEYVKDRMQFGRPIGSFQSVQHRMGDMLTAVEGGNLAAYRAIWKLQEGSSSKNEIAIAKAWLCKEGQPVLIGAHQLHGGMGIDMDYPLQFCFRRFKEMQVTLGSAPVHLKKIGHTLFRDETIVEGHLS